MQNSPEVALRWLEEAVLQAASDGHVTIKESQVQQVLKQVTACLFPWAFIQK